MKVTAVLATVASAAVLATFAPSAQADVPRLPVRCGMEVHEDAHLYLQRDLRCSTPFGVRVRGVNTDDGESSPQVSVDLRGHTLRGKGSGTAIDAYDYPNTPRVSVSGGRIERWGTAVTGLSTVRDVAVVGNDLGISCWEKCVSDRNYFRDNRVGLANAGESSAAISHSRFSRNEVAVEARNLGGTTVRHSTFVRNGVGVGIHFTLTPVLVSRSTFVRNRVAVLVEVGDTEGTCADLDRNRFVRNGRSLLGPAC